MTIDRTTSLALAVFELGEEYKNHQGLSDEYYFNIAYKFADTIVSTMFVADERTATEVRDAVWSLITSKYEK